VEGWQRLGFWCEDTVWWESEVLAFVMKWRLWLEVVMKVFGNTGGGVPWCAMEVVTGCKML